MSKDERKAMIERLAEKFMGVDEEDKAFLVGYMTGKEEERSKWERKQQVAATA